MRFAFAPIRTAPQAPETAAFAAKGQNIGAQHIEGGQCDDVKPVVLLVKGQRDDVILAIKACEEWEAGNGQRGDQPGDGRNRHILCQAAHFAHVLHLCVHRVVERVNNAACAQEEQCLEEGMGEEMIHTRANTKFGTPRYSKTNEHIAKLADSREGQHAFEVGLGERGQGCV